MSHRRTNSSSEEKPPIEGYHRDNEHDGMPFETCPGLIAIPETMEDDTEGHKVSTWSHGEMSIINYDSFIT